MKKLLSPLPAGGFPLVLEDILNLQDQVYATISQLYGAIAASFVVSGCTVTSSNAGTSTCGVSPGYVWLNNELRYFPGYTGTYPFYVVSAPDQIEPRTYFNGAVQNSYTTKTATTSPTSPGPGNSLSLLFNPGNTTQRLIPLVTATEATTRANVDAQLLQGLQDEVSSRIDGYNDLANTLQALQNQVNNLTQTVNTKVTRRFTFIPWTDLVLQAPFTAASPAFAYPPGFMRTEDGFIHLRGRFTLPPGSANTFTLPLADIPSGARTFNINIFQLTSANGEYKVSLQTNQNQFFVIGFPATSNASREIDLASLSYYADNAS